MGIPSNAFVFPSALPTQNSIVYHRALDYTLQHKRDS